jgi:hypothetical protein
MAVDKVRGPVRWYEHFVGECPLCGRDKSFRVARYTEPPPKAERYTPLPADQTYDHCDRKVAQY